ncbi:hypothetical protein GCM10018966_095060 [Streptomyces yanii]
MPAAACLAAGGSAGRVLSELAPATVTLWPPTCPSCPAAPLNGQRREPSSPLDEGTAACRSGVCLVEADRCLVLNLDEVGPRALLREHLDRAVPAELTEAAAPEASGWCDGCAHVVVVPLKPIPAAGLAPLPPPRPAPDPLPAFADTARAASTWSDERCDAGLPTDFRYPTSFRRPPRAG